MMPCLQFKAVEVLKYFWRGMEGWRFSRQHIRIFATLYDSFENYSVQLQKLALSCEVEILLDLIGAD